MQLPSAVVAAGVNVCSMRGWQSSATDCATRKGGNEETKGVGKALTAWAMASTAVPMRCSDSLIPSSEVWEDKEDSMESGDLPSSKCRALAKSCCAGKAREGGKGLV